MIMEIQHCHEFSGFYSNTNYPFIDNSMLMLTNKRKENSFFNGTKALKSFCFQSKSHIASYIVWSVFCLKPHRNACYVCDLMTEDKE